MARPSTTCSRRASAAAASAARGSGPSVPAFRYATEAHTGNSARKAAASMRAGTLPADGPGRRAPLRVQRGGALVLLGLGGRGRVARAADALPGLLVELVLAAVRA